MSCSTFQAGLLFSMNVVVRVIRYFEISSAYVVIMYECTSSGGIECMFRTWGVGTEGGAECKPHPCHDDLGDWIHSRLWLQM